jgi:hypothetical protein
MTLYGKVQFRSLLDSSSKRAKQAIDAEDAGNRAEAARLWRVIYGPEFPAL